MHEHDDDRGRAGPQRRDPQGDMQPAQGPIQQPAPQMQYERDQSAGDQGSQEPSQRRSGEIAHHDLERGLQDTDKGPVLDETYHRIRK